ncbi:MAG: tetratricopeptide repeat protein [Cyanobacteria bacterium J06633_8]
MMQNNLGIAYKDKIKGNKANNIEKAIYFYQTALQVFTREAFPQQWAWTQNNLGLAYSDRILGNKIENIENAIICYQAALKIRTQKDFPQDWAKVVLPILEIPAMNILVYQVALFVLVLRV